MPGERATNTQIVYLSSLSFHAVVPYLELVIRNGLVASVEGGVPRYKTTAKGEEALRHLRELEELMPERGELVAGDESILP